MAEGLQSQMRAAILLCGQMRRFQEPDVLQSLHRYFSMFDVCDIFVSSWSNRGVSYNHGHPLYRADAEDVITEFLIKAAFPTVRACAIHSLREWECRLDGTYKQVYEEGFEWNGMKIRGTVVPQLFTLWHANELRKEWERVTGAHYDVVIRCRPDAIFQHHSRSLYETVAPNTIYAINNPASGTYYPQRIYDIFFYGSPIAMDAVCSAFAHFPALVGAPWTNGLHPRDACRILYVAARFQHGLSIYDLPFDACTVKR